MTSLFLGSRFAVDGQADLGRFDLDADDLLTHAVIVGMTGCGKTGLVTVLVEEALKNAIPALVVDVKGDLANLKLAFGSLSPETIAPWVEPAPGDEDGIADPPVVEAAAAARKEGLRRWGIGEAELRAYAERSLVRVVTPGIDAGETVHLLSLLERRSARWDTDPDAARQNLSAAISLVLRLTGRDGEASRSREHALLSVLAERRLTSGRTATLEELIVEVIEPPVQVVGALPVETFVTLRQREALAADLNTLVASPTMAAWRRGQDLDVARWMEPVGGKTPATVVSVAHLEDGERMQVLGLLFEEVHAWVRSLPGTGRLKALVVLDELYGLLPPHPASPPTKRPLVTLMKQARAYGVGMVLATQNPMDLDYRALSNAGTWVLGRLQTDRDRARVLEALGEDQKKSRLGAMVKRLTPRWFVVKGAKSSALSLLTPRHTMSHLRGPMTPREVKRACEADAPEGA